MLAIIGGSGLTQLGSLEVRHSKVARTPFGEPSGPLTLGGIRGIVEKPAPERAPSNLAVVGRYVLTPRIFELLAALAPDTGGEVQLTDGISALLAHERVLAVRLPGKRYDCGSKLGYLKATVELGRRHPEIGAEFARYLKTLD